MKYFICFDVGLTGFFSIIEYDKNKFNIIHSETIKVESKDDFLYKIDKSKETKSMVKNQISFKKNYELLSKLIKDYNIDTNNCISFLEQLTPRPINSRISVMSLGDTGGCVRSIIESLNIKYLVITPKTWKDGIGVTSEKETSINYFKDKVDNKHITINDISKFLNRQNNYNHNQVESVLIAYWYYLKEVN